MNFWNQDFTIFYKLGDIPHKDEAMIIEDDNPTWAGLLAPSSFIKALQSKPKFNFRPQTQDHLMLSWLLYQLNCSFQELRYPTHNFICEKLDTKIGRQLSDSLSVCGAFSYSNFLSYSFRVQFETYPL